MQLKTANALLAAGVVLLTLVAAEVVLRLGAPVSDPFEDLKTRRFVNQYIRSSFTPRMRLETEAEAGLPGLAGKHVFTTNNVGLRGDSLAQPKPPDEYRVFMIGGSTVEGLYLGDSQTITAALQRALARTSPGRTVKVYNAGKSGDKSDDHVERHHTEREAEAQHPLEECIQVSIQQEHGREAGKRTDKRLWPAEPQGTGQQKQHAPDERRADLLSSPEIERLRLQRGAALDRLAGFASGCRLSTRPRR